MQLRVFAAVAVVATSVAILFFTMREDAGHDPAESTKRARNPEEPEPRELRGIPEPMAPKESEAQGPSLSIRALSPDGVPMPSARVWSAAASRRPGDIATPAALGVTDADGLAVIPAQSPLRLFATSADGLRATPATVEAGPGELVDLILHRAARVRGRVLNPPPLCQVLAYCPRWPEVPSNRVVPVASDGTFSVEGVVEYLGLMALAPGFLPSTYWKQQIVAGQEYEVELSLPRPAAAPAKIRLRIPRLEADMPEGAFVQFESHGGPRLPARVGPNGWLSVEHAAAGSPLKLVIWPAREPGDRKGWVTLQKEEVLAPDVWTKSPTIDVPLASRAEFVVENSEGVPVVDLPLRLHEGAIAGGLERSIAGATDERGRWAPLSAALRPEGTFTLAMPGGSALWTGEIEGIRSREVKIRLDGWGSTPLRLVDSSGLPCRAAHISVYLAQVGAQAQNASTPPTTGRDFGTTSDVRLHFPLSSAQDVEVRVHERFVGEHAVGPASSLAHGGVVELRPSPSTGVVTVHVSGEGGQPSAGSVAIISSMDDVAATYIAKTDKTGVARVVGVREGQYKYEVRGGLLRTPQLGVSVFVYPATNSDISVADPGG